MRLRFAAALVGVLVLGLGAASAEPAPAGQAAPAQQGLRQPDVIYVPTRQTVVDAMLKVASVKAGDVLYDLGCGDGRIPVTAAKLGARAVCIDIDPRRIAEANENVKKNNVGDRVRVLNQDLFTTDISEATVVSLYLLPSLNLKLRPTLWRDAEARHPHRLARLRHGRLEAGADAERRRRHGVLLDDYAGPGEEGGVGSEIVVVVLAVWQCWPSGSAGLLVVLVSSSS